jgi:hypothetical protein
MKWRLILPLALLLALGLTLGLTMTASAHGAKIEYTINVAVEIRATYDTGEPMDALSSRPTPPSQGPGTSRCARLVTATWSTYRSAKTWRSQAAPVTPPFRLC